MKKSILILCVALVAIFSAEQLFAQDIRIGIKTGIGYTSIPNSGDDASDDISYPFKLGFQAGGFAAFDFGAVALQFELFFSAQGGKVKSEGDEEYPEEVEHENLNYLQIPVLLRFGLPAGWYGFVGPQVGFFLHSGDDGFESLYKEIDVAAVLGLGYEFPSGLGLDLRYNLGLTNMYRDSALDRGPDEEKLDLRQSNQAIQLSVRYVIFTVEK